MSGPSRTSQAVAMVRVALQRPVSPEGDADAQALLCDGMRPAPIPALIAHLSARTTFIDDAVMAALDRDVRQVVVLGAGYDDRALRFRTTGVRFFELDHPGTQADKRRRVAALDTDASALTFVEADFRDSDVAQALDAAGHDPTLPTLFICEGLLVYLDQPVIISLLAALRDRAAEGSQLVASLAIHPDDLDSSLVVAERNAPRRAAAAEPWRTILPAAVHCDLLRIAGWSTAVAIEDHLVDPSALPGRSLLVAADPVY